MNDHEPNAPTSDTGMGKLAILPAATVLNSAELAKILGRSKKAVQRAVRRGELPAPFTFLGRSTWLAGTIREHFEAQQATAVKMADLHTKRLAQHSP